MTEEEIIRLFYPKKEILHDCASYPTSSSGNYIVTTDSQIQDVHFTLDLFSGRDVANRLFQVNLSDLCSQLGQPNWCVLNLGLPRKLLTPLIRFISDFAAELKRQCKKYKCPLIGGDTFRVHSQIFTSLTMSGITNRKISRTCPAHITKAYLYVSGNLGKSDYGLKLSHSHSRASKKKSQQTPFDRQHPLLPQKLKNECLSKYIRPKARFDLSRSLEKYTSKEHLYALIDISDGLYVDAHRIMAANSGTLTIDLECLPIDSKLKKFTTPEQIIFSGEELELLVIGSFELPNLLPIPIHLTRIGVLQSDIPTTTNNKGRSKSRSKSRSRDQSKVIFQKNRKPLKLNNQSYQHFS